MLLWQQHVLVCILEAVHLQNGRHVATASMLRVRSIHVQMLQSCSSQQLSVVGGTMIIEREGNHLCPAIV